MLARIYRHPHRHLVVSRIIKIIIGTPLADWEKFAAFLLQKIFKKADSPFDFCFSADILQAELVFTDNHYGKKMKASYKKLWKLLIDRDMSKTDLRLKAGISTMALAKLGKNENVSMEVLKKVCMALQCDIGDIMELIPENNSPEGN